MTALFLEGQFVQTKSGMTKGVILHIDPETGNLDIQATSGSKARYRNCLPDMWQQKPAEPDKPAKPPELRRGDKAHIIYKLGEEYCHRNGFVLAVRTIEVFLMFEDLDSAWVPRAFVVREWGSNAL